MGATRGEAQHQPQQEHMGPAPAAQTKRITLLRRRFDDFRRNHALRTRIPDPLRRATLEAIQWGASEYQVRQVCGISASQLDTWRERLNWVERSTSTHEISPRVFPVAHEVGEMEMQQERKPSQQAIELRLGGWTISIRPTTGGDDA